MTMTRHYARFFAALGCLGLVVFSAACSTATAPESRCPEEVRSVPIAADAPGVVAPRAVRRVEPHAHQSLVENGRVVSATLHAVVEPDGTVGDICIVSSEDPTWTAAVADALKKWEFEPGTVDGHPARVRFQLTTTFRPY